MHIENITNNCYLTCKDYPLKDTLWFVLPVFKSLMSKHFKPYPHKTWISTESSPALSS